MTTQQSTPPDWRQRPERSNIPVIRTMVWIALHLGRGAARTLLYPICLYFLLCSPRARTASADFLERVLGRRPRLLERLLHYHRFAATILDRVYFLNDQAKDFDIRLHCPADVEALLAGTGGVVLLGAHLGSFEAIRAVGRRRAQAAVKLVMYEENARKLNAVLGAINPALGQEIIGLGHCDSMLKVQECLERGDLVGLLADRALAGEKRIWRPFLGVPAGFPLGPFRIASMLRRPIVLMVGLYRGQARYDIHFELLQDAAEPARGQRTMQLEDTVTRYAERLEHYCRTDPFNWFNFYDFWA